jgi:hypothetical protein
MASENSGRLELLTGIPREQIKTDVHKEKSYTSDYLALFYRKYLVNLHAKTWARRHHILFFQFYKQLKFLIKYSSA